MQENVIRSIIAGMILGFIFGTIYYFCPAKCLITGPMYFDGIFIPPDLNNEIIEISMRWGGVAGIIIGIFGGLRFSIRLPRGHMSKSISCMAFIVCTILAFVMYGRQLSNMSAGRIAITFFYELFLFFLAIPIGSVFSFIEKIRE